MIYYFITNYGAFICTYTGFYKQYSYVLSIVHNLYFAKLSQAPAPAQLAGFS